jgi:hypothetical protein
MKNQSGWPIYPYVRDTNLGLQNMKQGHYDTYRHILYEYTGLKILNHLSSHIGFRAYGSQHLGNRSSYASVSVRRWQPL